MTRKLLLLFTLLFTTQVQAQDFRAIAAWADTPMNMAPGADIVAITLNYDDGTNRTYNGIILDQLLILAAPDTDPIYSAPFSYGAYTYYVHSYDANNCDLWTNAGSNTVSLVGGLTFGSATNFAGYGVPMFALFDNLGGLTGGPRSTKLVGAPGLDPELPLPSNPGPPSFGKPLILVAPKPLFTGPVLPYPAMPIFPMPVITTIITPTWPSIMPSPPRSLPSLTTFPSNPILVDVNPVDNPGLFTPIYNWFFAVPEVPEQGP